MAGASTQGKPNRGPGDGPSPDARQAALRALRRVLDDGRPLDDTALAGLLDGFDARDRAFARHLVMTALRRAGQIDDLIGRFLERRPKGRARQVVGVLRIGIAQALFCDVPAYAAVSTTVELARTTGLAPYAGLVNAVMRRAVREAGALAAGQDAARLNTPDWLWQAWSTAYGEATCRRIANAHLAEPPLDVTVKDDAPAWAGRLDGRLLPTDSVRLYPSGPVDGLPGYADGAWWVQDAAAALPARLLGDVRGRTVIDLCAAPGGKTLQLASAGGRVTAVDRSEERLARLRDNLHRVGLEAETVATDATTWQPPGPADAVLLDAPCTATGTIRRHPDALRIKRPEDVPAMARIQEALLAASAAMVRPGGLLVYCTCSLQPEEGPARIEAFLAANPSFRRVPVDPDEVGGLDEWLTMDGDLRTLPCHLADIGGMDGFYASRLHRTV